jgi:hypothetical protein
LPFVALGVLVATLATCFQVASAGGHRWGGALPVISSLGRDMPEHAWFAAGFTVLAGVMAVVFRTRARMLALEPRVARSLGLRLVGHACSLFAAVSLASMLVMAWIPDGASPLHFFAALATFGALALYELAHAGVCVALARPPARADDPPGPRSPGPLVRAWLFVCPFAAMACVYLWIGEGSVLAQWTAVALQFAYFLPLAPAFGEPAAPARRGGSPGSRGVAAIALAGC